jgi:hypothetical protein
LTADNTSTHSRESSCSTNMRTIPLRWVLRVCVILTIKLYSSIFSWCLCSGQWSLPLFLHFFCNLICDNFFDSCHFYFSDSCVDKSVLWSHSIMQHSCARPRQ